MLNSALFRYLDLIRIPIHTYCNSNLTQFNVSLNLKGEVYALWSTEPPLSAPTSNGSDTENMQGTVRPIVACPTCSPSMNSVPINGDGSNN